MGRRLTTGSTVRGVLVTLLAVATVVAGRAGTSTGDRVVERVQAWLDGADALTGRFEQRLLSGALGGDVVERGRLWIRRPGAMRWDYRDPERKVALVRDGRTLLYLEAEGQAIEGSLDGEGSLLTSLLTGTRPIVELFAVLPPSDDDPAAPDGTDVVRLRPREAEGGFESVALVVDRTDGAIRAARVRDAAGNVMDYRFPDLERVRGVPDRVFEFTPPPGTEILRDP